MRRAVRNWWREAVVWPLRNTFSQCDKERAGYTCSHGPRECSWGAARG